MPVLAHLPERFADAGQAGDHRRIADERAARRADRDVVAEAERVAEHQFVGGAHGGQLRDLDATVADTGPNAGDLGGRRCREVAHPRVVRIGAVVDAGDPGRTLDEVARAVAGHEHDRGGAVDRWADVVLAQRRNHVVLGEQVLGREVTRHRGGGAALGVAS